MHQYRGKLLVHCGSMFSGKTSALYRDVKRFTIAGYKVLVAKPAFDERYGKDQVVTHDQLGLECILFGTVDELKRKIEQENPDVLAIDEVQFIEGRTEDVLDLFEQLLQRNATIIAAGLDLDYLAQPFELTRELMALCDYLYKHHAVCAHCGNDGWISHRRIQNEDRLLLGSTNIYEPLCRSCYNKARKEQESYVKKYQVRLEETE
ncbi:MAG: thymidine kinase [Tissierellia bacterium]|nr:thymidine kinase [Tissierellia bacterium]